MGPDTHMAWHTLAEQCLEPEILAVFGLLLRYSHHNNLLYHPVLENANEICKFPVVQHIT